ncbi:IS3 family transposase [Undibacterium sp. CY7W]|uniref:IS3 family transposase n=1 Tax=Undibacterium rugosum TaxID=2762291 RepID=A0A923KZ77_9BURK|nr:IS3 family transposase [Undibacterium rugosum]MBC3935568.1 IS3 family transposase [Undibacterium rugosum]
MKRIKTYTPELREEAVKLVLTQGLTLEDAAARIAIPKGTLANWVSTAKRGTTPCAAPGSRTVPELEAENAKLRRELAEARVERDIVKLSGGVLCAGVAAKYAVMKTMRLHYPIAVMCRVFGVSRSGYYAWAKGTLSPRAQADERLKVAIKAVHTQSRETYGPLRMQPELAEQGFEAGRDRIARLRRELDLRCKQKRKFKATTNSNHDLPVADNLLKQKFVPTRPNEAWVTDITYIQTGEGWLYLAGVKDVFTCEIVGYAMGDRMTQALTAQALWRAATNKRPAPGLIHHSDRGSQYCAHDYRKLVEQFGMQASMSRKGNCYDNAPMESFWGSLKNELVHHQRYATRADAQSAIQEYIESFYNRQRRHSRLGNIPPALFAEFFSKQPQAA